MPRQVQGTRDYRPRPHVCEKCAAEGIEKRYSNPGDLASHKRSQHTGEGGPQKEPCDKCGKRISVDPSNNRRHRNRCQPAADARIWFVCPFCKGTSAGDSKPTSDCSFNLRRSHLPRCAWRLGVALPESLEKMRMADIKILQQQFLAQNGNRPPPRDDSAQVIDVSAEPEEEIQQPPQFVPEQAVEMPAAYEEETQPPQTEAAQAVARPVTNGPMSLFLLPLGVKPERVRVPSATEEQEMTDDVALPLCRPSLTPVQQSTIVNPHGYRHADETAHTSPSREGTGGDSSLPATFSMYEDEVKWNDFVNWDDFVRFD